MPDNDPNLIKEPDTLEPESPKPAEPVVETPPAIDYEKKFKESSKENQVLAAKLAAEEKARQELTKEPTDSELRTAFPEWEQMSETEKTLARRTLNSERVSQSALATASKFQQEREWATSLELAATDPALQGKEDAFKKYASKPQYRNVPTDVLVSAFLGTLTPASRPTPAPALLAGNGGPRETPKPKTITADELTSSVRPTLVNTRSTSRRMKST